MIQLLKRKRSGATPLDGVDVILADLDGVIYAGADAIPHAVESLTLAAAHHRVGYITNNAARTDASVAQHLVELGLDVQPSDVVTSPQAGVRLLAEHVDAGATILVVGGDGLVAEVEKGGYVVTRSADDNPAAVIQGFSPDLGWKDLAEAAFALQPRADGSELPWIATNTDWTIPLARGVAPGNGTMVSAVHTAVGRLAVVAGKPEVPIFDEARTRFGATSPLFIGDRLDTDILGANRAKMTSALVLTGIDRAKQVLAADQHSRPDFILSDLRQLHEPYPDLRITADGDEVRVGRAIVRINGIDIEIVRRGDSSIDLLRAGCALIWNSGRAIFGFRVPEALYASEPVL